MDDFEAPKFMETPIYYTQLEAYMTIDRRYIESHGFTLHRASCNGELNMFQWCLQPNQQRLKDDMLMRNLMSVHYSCKL